MCDDSDGTPAYVKVIAYPTEVNKKESGILSSFKKLIVPLLKKSDGLIKDYSEAKVKIEEASADIKVEEAIRIGTERNLTRQEELKLFCEIINEHFSDADTEAKIQLKMAKLLETNPEIEKQLNKVNSIITKLKNKGAKILIADANDINTEA